MDSLFTSNFRERFCKLLEEEKAAGKDQQKIADDLGVSKQTLTSWKNGSRSPRRPMLKQIAAYFGVSPLWLSGMREERDNFGEPFEQVSMIDMANQWLLEDLTSTPKKQKLINIIRDASEDQIDLLLSLAEAVIKNRK